MAKDEQTQCDFCVIVAERAPAVVVWQDDSSLAFFPLRPAAAGHTLLIPKVHYEDLFGMPESALSRLMHATAYVGRGLKAALRPDGMNIIHSAGEAASQSVFHAHVHLVPRWDGDRFGDIWPSSDLQVSERKEEIAELVRAALNP
ncbi:HIT family protein [Streptomyces sp. NPDC003393]